MIIGITQQHAVIWCGIVRFVQFSLPQRWQTLVSPERCNPLSPAALCDVGVVWARLIVAAALGGGGADTESPPPELRRLLSACSACCSMANVSSDRSCKLLTPRLMWRATAVVRRAYRPWGHHLAPSCERHVERDEIWTNKLEVHMISHDHDCIWQNMSSSVGITIPNIWKVIKFMFQTTNQSWISSNLPRWERGQRPNISSQ